MERKTTGLGPDTIGVMECPQCRCRAFQITSIKENSSFVRRGGRTNRFVCLGCGHESASIAQNINDLGQGWQQIKGRRTGIYLDVDEGVSDHKWLKWGQLDKIIQRMMNREKKHNQELEFYEKCINGFLDE